MSGRCKSCDAILTDEEMRTKDDDNNFIDVCFSCRASYFEDVYTTTNSTGEFFKEGRRLVHNYD